MDLFYEVRRQLRDPNRWVHEAYFRNRNDAEQFIEYRSKWAEERIPTFININYEIDEHKFSKFPSGLGAKKSEKTA